jgi:hypothetical protein
MKTDLRVDAVRLMREIRDEISSEIAGMEYKEQKRYIQDHLAGEKTSFKKKTRSAARTS